MKESNVISESNSSTGVLANGETFTGVFTNVLKHNSVIVAVKTDQNGILKVEFSPDGTNIDSTLTRYYRIDRINPPHRFTITRKYCRVTFENNSGSNQTFFRLQTLFGDKSDLNAPIDSTLSPNFDAICTRPTDYETEVALNRRQGDSLWNKFGYNNDVDVGTEVIASFGGTFSPMTSAVQLDISSSSSDDDDGGVGCNSLVLYGVDENWDEQIEVIALDGTNTVTTVNSWFGLNRASIYLAGTSQENVGTITIVPTGGGATQAEMPAGEGTTQQCIFFVPRRSQALANWLFVNALRQSAQNPKITIKGFVFSDVSNAKYEVVRFGIDTEVSNIVDLKPTSPFLIGEKSVFWLEATTDKADTQVSSRLSFKIVKDPDSF